MHFPYTYLFRYAAGEPRVRFLASKICLIIMAGDLSHFFQSRVSLTSFPNLLLMKCMVQCLVVAFLLLSACNDRLPSADSHLLSSENGNTDAKDTAMKQSKAEDDNSGISNDISVESFGGVQLSRAFLTYETDEQVTASNVTSLGKPIFLNLVLRKGWKEEVGEVSIGASQKISADDGTVLLDDADLFDNYKSISAEDAKYIKLKAVVNKLSPSIKYFVVDYQVWDKNSKGMIKGSYRFFVR